MGLCCSKRKKKKVLVKEFEDDGTNTAEEMFRRLEEQYKASTKALSKVNDTKITENVEDTEREKETSLEAKSLKESNDSERPIKRDVEYNSKDFKQVSGVENVPSALKRSSNDIRTAVKSPEAKSESDEEVEIAFIPRPLSDKPNKTHKKQFKSREMNAAARIPAVERQVAPRESKNSKTMIEEPRNHEPRI